MKLEDRAITIYERKIDSKWRLPIPKETIKESRVFDRRHLFLVKRLQYLILTNSDIIAKMNELTRDQPELRKIFAVSCYVPHDSQNRIVIPENFRDSEYLQGNVLMGAFPNHIEIYSPRAKSGQPASPYQQQKA